MGSNRFTSYGRGMDYAEPISGPLAPGERRYLWLVVARGIVTAAALMVAVAVVFQLGVLLVAAWVLAVVGGAGVTYLAFGRVEAVSGAALVTVLAAPLALLIVTLLWTIEPLALVAAGGWLYSKRDSQASARVNAWMACMGRGAG